MGNQSHDIRALIGKIDITIYLDNNIIVRAKPTVAKVIITNNSDISFSGAYLKRLFFQISKKSKNSSTFAVRREVFSSSFGNADLTSSNANVKLPSELRKGESFTFEVDLAKGIWYVSHSSARDFEQKEGLFPIPIGNYFSLAEIRVPDEKDRLLHMPLSSNELGVKIE